MEEIRLTSWYGEYPHYLHGFIHPNGGLRRISSNQQYPPEVWHVTPEKLPGPK